MDKHVTAVVLIAFLLQGMLLHVAPLVIASAVDGDFEQPYLQRVASAVDGDFEQPYLQPAS